MSLLSWVGFFAVSVIVGYLPLAHVIVKTIRRGYSERLKQHGRVVCLTFDDGPDPVATPIILNELERHGVRATFFVLGGHAARCADVIAAIVRGGHEIGEHGYAHLHPWYTMPWSYFRDLVLGHKTLSLMSDMRRQKLFRPAYGKANALTFFFLWIFRRVFAFWNIDVHDYKSESTEEVVQSVLSKVRATRGASIVLLHDGRTKRRKRIAATTAAAVGPICRELLSEGYQFRTVSELAASLRSQPLLAEK